METFQTIKLNVPLNYEVSKFLKNASPEETEYILNYGEYLLQRHQSLDKYQGNQDIIQHSKQIEELKQEMKLIKNQTEEQLKYQLKQFELFINETFELVQDNEDEIQSIRNTYHNDTMSELSKMNLEISNLKKIITDKLKV